MLLLLLLSCSGGGGRLQACFSLAASFFLVAAAGRRQCNDEGRSEGRLGSSFQTASIAFYVVLNVEKHDGKACDITC